MNDMLTTDFTLDEVNATFLTIQPHKAPGIDGLPGSFIRTFWPLVGDDVLTLCLDLLAGRSSVEIVNETVLVLIPKVTTPDILRQFRPIALCTVMYKIISKVLVIIDFDSQHVNFAKSSVFFGNHPPPQLRITLSAILDVTVLEEPSIYGGHLAFILVEGFGDVTIILLVYWPVFCRLSIFPMAILLKLELGCDLPMLGETYLFSYRWGGSSHVGLTERYNDNDTNPVRCGEFMVPNQARWNEPLVKLIFSSVDADSILSCPIAPTVDGVFIWSGHSSGVYSVRSGYFYVLRRQRFQRLFLSLLSVPPKNRIFGWRLAHEALPYVPARRLFQLLMQLLVYHDLLYQRKMSCTQRQVSLVVSCQAVPLPGCSYVGIAEAKALTYKIRLAIELSCSQILIESDAQNIFRQLTSSQLDMSTVGYHLAEARQLLRDYAGFQVNGIRRITNWAAHNLANYALNISMPMFYSYDSPYCLSHVLLTDATNG
ncbi:hypothetical protein F3Y22_tig00117034pilonHSYRG00441 [Hibiscus syriacus]|uniref:RNase H type-1 domain-containing protein n=1 Tax=Hibiscus syriacus TaxID=106335 RepID=A0A6A2WAR6_HIBSY|nr:hypothetical protein F3Y22_tig00117034pilonHSYRG00441 [Hibiscus syriacus]